MLANVVEQSSVQNDNNTLERQPTQIKPALTSDQGKKHEYKKYLKITQFIKKLINSDYVY